MKKPKFAIKDWNDDLESVECEVVNIEHRMFDMFDVNYIDPDGKRASTLVVLRALIPKNKEAEETIERIVGTLTGKGSA